MDHRADIGFVNAHTKRDRRDHYLDLARKELLLDPLAVLGIEPGVIVDLDGETFNGSRFMDVLWDGRKVMMFTNELELNAVPA